MLKTDPKKFLSSSWYNDLTFYEKKNSTSQSLYGSAPLKVPLYFWASSLINVFKMTCLGLMIGTISGYRMTRTRRDYRTPRPFMTCGSGINLHYINLLLTSFLISCLGKPQKKILLLMAGPLRGGRRVKGWAIKEKITFF